MDFKTLAETLQKDGVVVIPVYQDVTSLNKEFYQTCLSFPEWKSIPEKFVFPLFGALGNPASFHNPFVRRLRLSLMETAISLFGHLREKGDFLEQLFDRMCIRKVGTKIQGETWHKDVSPHSLPGDRIFGGWINLDVTRTQSFSCVPGSHKEETTRTGFAREEKQEGKEIIIPPGHWICFYQNITHQVIPKVIKGEDSIRLFVGFRLTRSELELYNNSNVISPQGVPILPGGMKPQMYEKNNLRFHKEKLLIWSSSFREECVTKGLVESSMKSLLEYGFPLYDQYSEEEIRIMQPRNYW